MYGQVYLITNTVNGKRYVGLTKKPIGYRWSQHTHDARKHKGTSRPLLNAINKYGKDAFSIVAIYSALDEYALIEAEKVIISELKPEYNATNGGETTSGRAKKRTHNSEASKEKVSAALRAYHARKTEEERDAVRRKISVSVKKYLSDPAVRKNLSVAVKAYYANKGA